MHKTLKSMVMTAAFLLSACVVLPTDTFAFGMNRTVQAPAWGNDISAEKQAAVQKIFEKSWNETLSTRQSLAAKYSELNALLVSNAPDAAKIETLSREIGELRGEMLKSRNKVRAQLAELGLPADYYAYHGMNGHNGSWHEGGYGFNHGRRSGRMNQGKQFNWLND